ncbi:MAG: ATP-binding protein [Desulfurococcales archaeon]|nr:ATP-binding protein [Desulfurococcales archaeon]
MLFDPRPKTRREELYDRDSELTALEEFVDRGSPLMVVFGIRRVGKTSVVKVFLSEANIPYIYIDARVFEEGGFRKELVYRVLSEELNRLRGRWHSILEYLKVVEGVEVSGFSVRFDLRRRLSLVEVFKKLDEWAGDSGRKIIIAVDEAQLLRYLKGGKGRIDFTAVISYCYDNLSHIKFVITGSEVGVLRDFLGFNDPSSWLYGRIRDELIVERFDREKSIDFLEKGFSECGVKSPITVIEEIVNKVDGIPGWLTYFGYRFCKNPDPGVIREAFNEAKAMALSEVKKLPSKYYIYALKAIALGYNRWKSIKQAMEVWVGHSLSNAQVSRTLQMLSKLSFIEKRDDEYIILDPVIAEAVKEL